MFIIRIYLDLHLEHFLNTRNNLKIAHYFIKIKKNPFILGNS
jgi:hypothetical protein